MGRKRLPEVAEQTCTKCGLGKPLASFHKDAHLKRGVRRVCKGCVAMRMRAKYAENADAMRAKTAAWREKNRDRYQAYMNVYQAENRDARNEYRRQLRLKNIESERARDKRYTENNRAKVYAKNARRRAAETRATPAWLTAVHHAQIQEFYEISLARSTQTGIEHGVDHIVPLRGTGIRGLHVPWNLQVLTKTENSRKYNKLTGMRA